MTRRIEAKCTWCGGSTTSTKKVCRGCQRPMREAIEAIGLRGGKWVSERGIQVWVTDKECA